MRRVFVDASGFYAALVAEDSHHRRAVPVFARASSERWQLVTTNAVVFETYALLLARSQSGRRNALAFLDMLDSDEYVVERVRESDETNAIELVRRHDDKTYSLCDALSFVVMERLHISEAIAFDRHFGEYGRFTLL